MIRNSLRGWFAAVSCACLFACSSARELQPYPHESTLAVIAELRIHLRADPFRDAAGRDLEGRNIYRVTLDRISQLQDLTPAEYDDVLAFAAAECFERLGQWGDAGASFRAVAEAGTILADEAKRRGAWADRMLEATAETDTARTIEGFLNASELRRAGFLRLLDENPPVPYDGFIRREAEDELRQRATFLFANRFVVDGGTDRAIEAARKLVAETKESHRHGFNLILLGRFFEALAADYAVFTDPESGEFDAEKWTAWVDEARGVYRKVAQTDGDPAKPEGLARLRALDAFALRALDGAR